MSVQLVRVGVHGDEVRVIRLEGSKNRVLQDRLVQDLLGLPCGGVGRVERGSTTGGLVELQGPARLAVFVGPQPRLEGLEELEPGRLLIPFVVIAIDDRGVLGLSPVHCGRKKLPPKMGVFRRFADAALGSGGFAGGPWDETAGFARGPHERLRVVYAVPFGGLTT